MNTKSQEEHLRHIKLKLAYLTPGYMFNRYYKNYWIQSTYNKPRWYEIIFNLFKK